MPQKPPRILRPNPRDRYNDAVKHEPGIFEQPNPEAEDASIARARADIAAGRYHDQAIVHEWLETWGQPGRLPFREWLAKRDG